MLGVEYYEYYTRSSSQSTMRFYLKYSGSKYDVVFAYMFVQSCGKVFPQKNYWHTKYYF